MTSDQNCIFCKIVSGEAPCYKVWENETHIAFLNLWPNTKGYTVVAAKEHNPGYFVEANNNIVNQTVDAARQVAERLDEVFDDSTRCGFIFDGMGVDHLHAHVIPMHGTDNMDSLPDFSVKMTEYFEKHPGYLSSHNAEEADPSELATLAEKIRGE